MAGGRGSTQLSHNINTNELTHEKWIRDGIATLKWQTITRVNKLTKKKENKMCVAAAPAPAHRSQPIWIWAYCIICCLEYIRNWPARKLFRCGCCIQWWITLTTKELYAAVGSDIYLQNYWHVQSTCLFVYTINGHNRQADLSMWFMPNSTTYEEIIAAFIVVLQIDIPHLSLVAINWKFA